MVVETQHFVGFCHYQMQVVRHHQHGAIKFPTELVDQIIKRNLTIHIHTLSWFIQYQQLRAAQQRAGKQNTLSFTAGQFLQRRIDKMARLHAFQRRENIGFTGAGAQTQETADRQRQRGVEMKFLRHITNTQFFLALNHAFIGCDQTQHHAHQGGFACAIGAEQRQNFAGLQIERHVREDAALPE